MRIRRIIITSFVIGIFCNIAAFYILLEPNGKDYAVFTSINKPILFLYNIFIDLSSDHNHVLLSFYLFMTSYLVAGFLYCILLFSFVCFLKYLYLKILKLKKPKN